MNTKKFNSSVVPSLFAAAGGTVLKDSRRTSLSRDGKMMVGAGAVALQRAHTPADRRHVVCLVKEHWDRVGQRPREHLLVWDTAEHCSEMRVECGSHQEQKLELAKRVLQLDEGERVEGFSPSTPSPRSSGCKENYRFDTLPLLYSML